MSSEILVAQQPFSREKRDYVWMFGRDSAEFLNAKNLWLDFKDNPPSIHVKPGNIGIDITNTSMCDTSGNLLFYTNGFVVMNGNHEIVENGEGLNPGVLTDNWLPYGQPLDQGAIALPLPGSDSIYYLIHGRREWLLDGPDMYGLISSVFPLFYSVIEFSTGHPQGIVVEKNVVLIDSTISLGKLTTVRHANGRDWWIIVFNYFANTYHRFLLHPGGITELPLESVGDSIPSGVGQAVFSPDGTKYAKLNLYQVAQDQYLDIYDFDRCTGLLYNPVQLLYRDTALHGGLAFSPNSRYLYVSSDRYVYQYDVQAEDIAASQIEIAAVPPVSGETDFALAQLGPDQKIYVGGYDIKSLHIIKNANAGELTCNFEIDAINFGYSIERSIPNHPNYGLGPLDGSPCDTLGIDNYPQAAFQHSAQALEASFWDYSLFSPTEWYWDFGDGTMGSTQQNPVHVYSTPGVYEVCLTVSNISGSDTHCEVVMLGTTATQEAVATPIQAKAYPNPARNTLHVELTNPTPLTITLLDMYGRILQVQQAGEAPTGQTLTFDTSGLNSGLYLLELSGLNTTRQMMRVVIMK